MGLRRENYKIERYHQENEQGKYLIRVDVCAEQRPLVKELMNFEFSQHSPSGRQHNVAQSAGASKGNAPADCTLVSCPASAFLSEVPTHDMLSPLLERSARHARTKIRGLL